MGCAASSASVSKLCGCVVWIDVPLPHLLRRCVAVVCVQVMKGSCARYKPAMLHVCAPNWLTLGFDYICAQIG